MLFFNKNSNKKEKFSSFWMMKMFNVFKKKNKQKSAVHFIHIGKCGGSSLGKAVESSDKLKENFERINYTHVHKPKLEPNEQYLICIRNPVSRALSAFNWRYHLVVDTEEQKDRFQGEKEILEKYGTLERLAESLYVDGALVQEVALELRKIHHLREDINFYLEDLFKTSNANSFFAILEQKNLNSDIERYLGVKPPVPQRSHRSNTPEDKLNLSFQAIENLEKFFHKDYICITKLYEQGAIDLDKMIRLCSYSQ